MGESMYTSGLVTIDVMIQALETCVSETMYISRPFDD